MWFPRRLLKVVLLPLDFLGMFTPRTQPAYCEKTQGARGEAHGERNQAPGPHPCWVSSTNLSVKLKMDPPAPNWSTPPLPNTTGGSNKPYLRTLSLPSSKFQICDQNKWLSLFETIAFEVVCYARITNWNTVGYLKVLPWQRASSVRHCLWDQAAHVNFKGLKESSEFFKDSVSGSLKRPEEAVDESLKKS